MERLAGEPNRKGCRELLMHRMLLAIVSSILVQFVFVSCLILLTNLSGDYTSWIRDTWLTVTSFRMWSYFLVLATITFLQGVTCSKLYLSTPPYLKSRFTKLCGILTSQNALLGSLYITIGGILVWLHLSLKGGRYGSLTGNCGSSYGTCLVEEHYFLLLSGLWSGLYFFAKTKVFHVKYLKFPVIPLSKFSRLQRGIWSMLPSVMMASAWPTFYYLSAYYFLGAHLRSAIMFLTGARLETDPLDSVSRISSFSLIFHLWLYQLIFMLSINSMYLLFEVYLTEWIPFDVRQGNALYNEESGLALYEVLSMDNIPIMQHLGYLDLVTVAQKDRYRRNQLFTLSQPGGHPYNWNCAVEKVIGLVKKFSEDLSTASVKVQDQTQTMPNLAPINTFHKEYVYHMRNLVTEELPPKEETVAQQQPVNESAISKFARAKWQNFVAYLFSKPIVQYMFGEQDGGRVCYVLFSGQSVIWAAEAISSLAVLSLTEDAYGIVQKDLPQIIKTLLGLKQSLDKLHKSNILAKRQLGDDEFVRQIFTALRTAVRRSLYRIVTHYESYIGDIPLESGATEQLQHFLNYRE